MRKIASFLLILLLLGVAEFSYATDASRREFGQFSLLMPEGWDGDEQTGFISDNPEEYQLTLGLVRDGKFAAQVSIFMLPNRPKASAEKAARQLAEAQGNASEPVQEGNFWIFCGEPRTRAVQGTAKTLVNTTPEHMLIIIAQDPDNLGSEQILKSLAAETPLARSLLGR